ncbi:unnamed protein product [Musa hybrid cultivar]
MINASSVFMPVGTQATHLRTARFIAALIPEVCRNYTRVTSLLTLHCDERSNGFSASVLS